MSASSVTLPRVMPVAERRVTEAPPREHRSHTLWIALATMVVVAAFAALFMLGELPRVRREEALDAATAQAAADPPVVNIVLPHRAAAQSERVLPGNALPYLQANIYARTNGYLKRRLVDIGDRVKQGQLLAEIAAPDVDAQLDQARAQVLQEKANLLRTQADELYAQQEEARYRTLVASKTTTVEEYQNKVALLKVATANVGASQAAIAVDEANVERLSTLQSFQKLTAPFDGVITARNVDPGDLITADSPNSERLLFRVEATDPLRVFVDVPQVYATAVKTGQKAILYRREDPAHEFVGHVTRSADSLDQNTRTLLTEVQVPNPDGALRSGMYLQVKLVLDQVGAPVLIPTASLVTRSDGPTVAVLEPGNKVGYRKVQLGRDYGAEIEIIAGLTGNEQIIMHPGDDLPAGVVVSPLHAQENR